jgi:hypothetical protein
MSALLEFECRVPVDGYKVIDDPNEKGARVLRPRSKQTRRFDLFKHGSSAFLEFAETPTTEDGVKGFADRYGEVAEDISIWFPFIRKMRRMVETWEMSVKTGDFSKIIRSVKDHFVDWNRGSEIISPLPGLGVGVLVKKDSSSASPRLCIRPQGLYEALLVQLLLTIDGNQHLRTCIQCRKWFKVAAGRGRSDKEYCSNACRMRAYRKRKGSAVEAGNGSGVE